MKNVFRIIEKNIKLLLRAKSSALIVIVAPLLVILLVGMAFDNANAFAISIGLLSTPQNPDVEEIITQLSERDFRLVQYDDIDTCVNEIKNGVINTCVVFPEDFKLQENTQQEITFYVDYSKVNLVWMIMETLQSRIGSKESEVARDLANLLLTRLDNSKTHAITSKPIIHQLRQDNQQLITNIQTVKSSFGGLDLNYPEQSLPIVQAKEMISKVRGELDTYLTSARTKATTTKNTLNGQAIGETTKQEMISSLTQAITDLTAALTRIHSTSEDSVTKVAGHLTDVQNTLSKMKQNLLAAGASRDSSVASLSAGEQTLQRSIKDLDIVAKEIDAMIQEITSIKVTNADVISNPIVTKIEPVAAKQTYINYLFPSLIILVIMFISILLGTTLVMMEKHSPAYFRNFITPTKGIIFIVSTYLSTLIMVFFQVAIILAIALYFFVDLLLSSLGVVFVILFVTASLFVLVGMAIGYLFSSEETATLAAVFTGSLLLLFSHLILPLESMPATFRAVAQYNPFVVAERMLKETILFQQSFGAIYDDLLLLFGISVFLFVALWLGQRVVERHYMEKFEYALSKRTKTKLMKKQRESAKKQIEKEEK